MNKTIEYIEKNLTNADFMYYPLAPNRITDTDIDDVEKELGIKFPNDYREHLLGSHPGILVEATDEVWPKSRKGGAFWMFLYGLQTYSASKESEDWMRLSIQGKKFMEETGLKAVPILKRSLDADFYCVDETSKIVQFFHEELILKEVNLSFWELFDQELKELELRKERMKELIRTK